MKKTITTLLSLLLLLVPIMSMAQDDYYTVFTTRISNNDLYDLDMTFSLYETDGLVDTEDEGKHFYYAECGNALDYYASTSCIDESYTGDVVIPDYVQYNGKTYTVNAIRPGAFEECRMSSLTLPSTLEHLEYHSIVRCMNLRSIFIPASVYDISSPNYSESPFVDDYNLSELTVDPANQYYSAVDNVLFNKKQTKLLFSPRARVNTDYTIPSTVTSIDVYAFDGNRFLEHVTIPNTIKEIPSGTFDGCSNLNSVSIPSSVTKIGSAAFGGCYSLPSITIPSSVNRNWNRCFSWLS